MANSNIHKEHRLRMKRRFRESGLNSFSDHEVLELLLFFGIPYKNTNELAHHLLNRFGSFSAVLEADYVELLREKGIAENSGTLLTLIPELLKRYSVDKQMNGRRFKCMTDIGEYMVNSYIGSTKEHVDLLIFDISMNMKDHVRLGEGSFEQAMLDAGKLAEIVFSYPASNFLLAHNHPSGDVEPSDADLIITREIYKAFIPFKKYMLAHFIVAGGKYKDVLPQAVVIKSEDEFDFQKFDFH